MTDEVIDMNRIKRFGRTVFEVVFEALELNGRAHALATLRRMDQRFLVEHGYSPELMKKGLAGWPWRLEETSQVKNAVSEEQARTAEAELRAYSDAELADLGISRSQIPYAVRYGRPGIDDKAA